MIGLRVHERLVYHSSMEVYLEWIGLTGIPNG